MARLPVVGDDAGQWAAILNEFLQVSLKPDGTLIVTPMQNPMNSPGDLIVGAAGGQPVRVAIGPNTWVLTVVNGQIVWAPAATGFQNPMSSTGDLIAGGPGGAATRLAVGGAGQVLGVVSGAPAWVTNPTGFSNPMTTPGDIITGGAAGAAQRLAAGSAGQVLSIVSGVPAWAANPAGFTNPMTAGGDIIVGGALGAPGRLAVGAAGQVLTVIGGVPVWNNPSTPQGTPLNGPDPSHPTVWQLADQSIMVLPLSFYSLSGDDATWINTGLSLLTAPGVTGPTVCHLQAGGNFSTASPVGLANWTPGTYLDMNGATISNSDTTAGHYAVDFQGQLVGGFYPVNYPSGGAYNGNIVSVATSGSVGGLRYGAGQGFLFDNLRITNFRGLGCIQQNNNGWTEKTRLNVYIWCTQPATAAFQFDSPGGTQPSHEYNNWDIKIRCPKSVTGVIGSNGAFTSGSHIRISGNFAAAFGTIAGAAACLDLSQGTGGGTMDRSYIELMVETTGSGAFNWQTIKFGGSAQGSMNNSMGMIRLSGNNWTVTDAVAANFSFGGSVYEAGLTGLTGINTKPSGWL